MMDTNQTVAVAAFLTGAAVTIVLMVLVLAGAVSGTPARPAGTDPAPGCAEWTDGCVICRRTADGPACSTPGIACTRGPIRCERRS